MIAPDCASLGEGVEVCLNKYTYWQNISTQGRREDENPVTIMSFSPHPLENSSACTYKEKDERERVLERKERERERERERRGS